MPNYRHVIWDWNGTLIDDAWVCVEILNDLLARRGLQPVTLSAYEEEFCFPIKDYYCKVGFDFTREPFPAVANEFVDRYIQRYRACGLRTGARETIEAIRAQGLTQSILSAYEQKNLEDAVAAMGLTGMFTHLVGLDDHYAHDKLETGRRLIRMLSGGNGNALPKGSALLIGDTLHDWDVAQAIGVDCMLVYSGHFSRRKLAETGASVVESLSEVLNLIE